MNYCIVIPTYNNQATLKGVVDRCLNVTKNLIVVNDGSTDGTDALLVPYSLRGVEVVSYMPNRGKGNALRRGLQRAREMGFDYAVTLDADGQHYPEDVPLLLDAISKVKSDNVLAVGSRQFDVEGMPSGNRFANRFSNFWFRLQTGLSLPDTQTGFRVYPLRHLPCLRCLTSRYESELELLVFSAWKGVRLLPVEVRVYYPPKEERVSHFRPFADFVRISILNALLCVGAVLYGYPVKLFRKIDIFFNNPPKKATNKNIC